MRRFIDDGIKALVDRTPVLGTAAPPPDQRPQRRLSRSALPIQFHAIAQSVEPSVERNFEPCGIAFDYFRVHAAKSSNAPYAGFSGLLVIE